MPRSLPPLILALLSLLLHACAGADPEAPTGTYDASLEAAERAKRESTGIPKEDAALLLQIDQAMDSYVSALSNTGAPTWDTKRERLERLLRQLVSGNPAGANTRKLIALASDGTDPFYQGIALAALGFADSGDVMPVILQGAQLSDPDLVDRAVLGLALLADPRTPPGVVAAVMNDERHPEAGRINAAWALVTLQKKSLHAAEIVPLWRRMLDGGGDVHPLLLANALRGLGIARDPADAELAARFLTHPTPRVRMMAAAALGFMNAQGQVEKLLLLLAPSETTPNVRLAARMALRELAGGVDRGYDVERWRQEFQRTR